MSDSEDDMAALAQMYEDRFVEKGIHYKEVNVAGSETETKELAVSDKEVAMGGQLLEESEMIYPILKLLQKKENAGKYELSVTGECFDIAEVVFLGFRKGRIMFDADLTKPPLCGSHDRVKPWDRGTPMAETCAVCPYHRKGSTYGSVDGAGKEKEVVCAESITLRGMNLNSMLPFELRVKGFYQNSPFLEFLSMVQFNFPIRRLALCNYKVELSSNYKTIPAGSFYVPVVKPDYKHPIKQDELSKLFEELKTAEFDSNDNEPGSGPDELV